MTFHQVWGHTFLLALRGVQVVAASLGDVCHISFFKLRHKFWFLMLHERCIRSLFTPECLAIIFWIGSSNFSGVSVQWCLKIEIWSFHKSLLGIVRWHNIMTKWWQWHGICKKTFWSLFCILQWLSDHQTCPFLPCWDSYCWLILCVMQRRRKRAKKKNLWLLNWLTSA